MLTISTETSDVNLDTVCGWLSTSYWAKDRPREIQETAVANSLNISAFKEGKQVGYARVVTDRATFAWLCDVFVDEACRGEKIGHRLMEEVVAHPDLQSVNRILLATRDAEWLYTKFGFKQLPSPERWWVRPKIVAMAE